jgi:Na+/proline symporter/CheY-like chemotaxis protein/anti-sigma regulatory factor (Ser/Thr protein kinase)
MQAWLLLLISLAYIGLLFAIAYLGDRHPKGWPGLSGKPVVYALSLAIYCTSWTFYGSVGRASTSGPDFLLIYVGPILVVTLGYPILERMVALAKRHNVTSIADFVGARYGKSRGAAALVTVICALGVLPYIALQLKAISATFDALADSPDPVRASFPDSAFLLAMMLAVFTILFGIRAVQATEQHRGMMLAIAFESLVKLAAFLAAGVFVWSVTLGGLDGLVAKLEANTRVAERLAGGDIDANWLVLGLLSAAAFLCLPRQFHVAVVEHDHPQNLRWARWLFPLYLVAINIFVIPIAAGGLLAGPQAGDPDLFVLSVPLAEGATGLSVLVYIGGLSAATSMVIVACLALSIMVSNELVVPFLLGGRRRQGQDLGRKVLRARRIAVVAILLAAYAYNNSIAEALPLVSIGLISFAAVAQVAPALLLGLFWRGAHRHGAVAGLVAGFAVWAYTLLLPSLFGNRGDILAMLWPETGEVLSPLSQGVVASLTVNLLCLVVGSLVARRHQRDLDQAALFVSAGRQAAAGPARGRADLAIADLKPLLARFVGAEQAERAFAGQPEGAVAAAHAERLLSGVIGAASARIVLASLNPAAKVSPRRARALLDEAGEAIVQNFELLRTTLDHVSQGIGVFDGKGCLATWNDRFFQLLRLPSSLAAVGQPGHRLTEAAPDEVAPLLASLGGAQPRVSEADFADGGSLELRLDPLPGGGLSLTVTDVTDRRRAELALRQAKETLERSVSERTADLTKLVGELDRARGAAEAANLGKTRFIAAASHDLLQPLHATRLFTSALVERHRDEPLVAKIDQGLGAVEALLDTLLDISRLDSGQWKAEPRPVRLQPLIESLAAALAPLAARRGVEVVVVPTSLAVESDPQLLRRVLQNFLSNAIRYSEPGRPRARVLIGARRRRGGQVEIQVCDSGPGIPAAEQERIFDEFVRLAPAADATDRGLGLGLAIVRRVCHLLGHRLVLRSREGVGSLFGLVLPLSAMPGEARGEPPAQRWGARGILGARILVVDDEPVVREATAALLAGWGCRALTVADAAAALAANPPADALLVDLDLGPGDDGLALIASLRRQAGWAIPAALVTAKRDERLRRRARQAAVEVLLKPLKPASLRAFLEQACRQGELRRRQAAEPATSAAGR